MFSCETHSHHSLLATRAKTVAEKTPYKRFGNNDKKEVRSSQRVRTPSRLARLATRTPKGQQEPGGQYRSTGRGVYGYPGMSLWSPVVLPR
jgi:hypothetical protein